jgi:F-type H+-transporting ATPase subunit epsilon
MAFKCTIVTPELQVLDEMVDQVILPAHDGLVGILTGRAPLLVKLGIGVLRVDAKKGQRFFVIEGGVAQMKDDVLTVVTEACTAASDIDIEAAKAEYAEAAARRPLDAASAEARRKQMERAKAKQQLAGAR